MKVSNIYWRTTVHPNILANSSTGVHLSNSTRCTQSIDSSLENELYSAFMILVFLITVLGNIVVILAVLLSKKLRERTTFYFVASLALSDMMIALFQIPFRISMKYHDMYFCFDESVCFMRMIMDVIGNIASILNLLFISIDRFVAVTYPYRYAEYLSPKRCKIIILITWIFSISWSVLGIFRWHKYENNSNNNVFSIKVSMFCINENRYFFVASFCGIFVPSLIAMTCTYIKILHIAFTQIQKIARTTTVTKMPSPMSTSTDDIRQYKTKRRVSKGSSVLKELKATKSIATVYVAFCACWLPCTIFHLLLLFNSQFTLTKTVWFVFIDILPVVNTSTNPIIYSFFNKEFRTALQYICRKVLVKTHVTDTYLSREQQTRRIAGVGTRTTTGSTPMSTVKNGKLTIVGEDNAGMDY